MPDAQRPFEAETRGEQTLVVDGLKLLRDFAQLSVGLRFPRPQHDIEPHRFVRVRRHAVATGNVGDVFDPVDDLLQPTARAGHWGVQGRPISFLEFPIPPADIVPLHRHRVWSSLGKD